jgi:hypothetical protein
MADLISWIYFSIPFAAVAGVAMLAVLGIGIGLVSPRVLAFAYLAIFFAFNSTSYGSLSMFATGGVYSRGSGMLLFALVLWCVLGAWCCARASAAFAGRPAPASNLRPWFTGWLILLVLHVGAALASGVKVAAALAPSGFANIVWMAPAIFLLQESFRTRAHTLELMRFIMLAGGARALFGLVRWVAMGGDPNNVYANRNAIPIRLTFFDINDSLLCCLAVTIAALFLLRPDTRKESAAAAHPAWKWLAWGTLLACSLSILLSYRRTAWIGSVLAGAVIAWRFPWRRRWQLLAMGLPPLGLGIGALLARRFAQSEQHGLSSMVYDMQSRRFGAESERVLELKLALADFLAHPLSGIGAWGRYAGFEHISWQANLDGGLFVHSGVLHIALKAGLPGLVLLGGLAWAWMRTSRAALREHAGGMDAGGDAAFPGLALATAGAAGLAFMLPDILVGTPVPQVRTTQMLAICMALPYIARQAARSAQQGASGGRGQEMAGAAPPLAPVATAARSARSARSARPARASTAASAAAAGPAFTAAPAPAKSADAKSGPASSGAPP